MPKCRDCVHWEICNPIVSASEDSCTFYKGSSRFVELPCKIGDMVYVLKGEHIEFAHVIAIYLDSSGGMFDLKIFKEIAINFYISKYNTFENIGKTVFLTREEAEQALKERESNA